MAGTRRLRYLLRPDGEERRLVTLWNAEPHEIQYFVSRGYVEVDADAYEMLLRESRAEERARLRRG